MDIIASTDTIDRPSTIAWPDAGKLGWVVSPSMSDISRPASVTAVGNRLCTAGTPFGYDDYMAATFQFPSGLIGRITANFGCVHRHQHVVRVFGTRATFVSDDQGARLHTDSDPSVTAKALTLAALPASKGDLIPDFVRGIQQRDEARQQALYEFDVVSACLAADQSAWAGAAIKVEHV